MRRPRRAALTSMFLQATFFTTAGNRSEAFFPRAIIWAEGQGRGRKGRERASTQQRRSTGDQDSLTLGPPPPGEGPSPPAPAHRHDPLHGLQLEGVFVGVQHLLQVVMPGGGTRGQLRARGGVGLPHRNTPPPGEGSRAQVRGLGAGRNRTVAVPLGASGS